MMTDEREQKLKMLAANRQTDLTIILENIYDPHNLGAVLRTCDSVGLVEIYALYTIESPETLKDMIGFKSSSGSKKWVDVIFHTDVTTCVNEVKRKYSKIYGTHLGEDAVSLYDLELSSSVALVFGNEQRGISESLFPYLDGNFVIPQSGLVQSLNISVACAVSLYEAKRQRIVNGQYGKSYDEDNVIHHQLYEKYVSKSRGW